MKESRKLDLAAVFAAIEEGKSEVRCSVGEILFSQGDPADAVYYVQAGRLKGAVVSPQGKEAAVTIFEPGDFCAVWCLNGHSQHLMSATAMTDSVLARLEKSDLIHVLHQNATFSDFFISHLVGQHVRIQEALVDRLLNPAEKRLARLLLILATIGDEHQKMVVPKISQETLAEMVGTTRARVNMFMNKFRKLGLIDYNGSVTIHKPLLDFVLHERPARPISPR